jgi:monoamine oxidase
MDPILNSHKLKSELSILIVGAGASGLSCCNKLLSKGFTNIKILEASNMIGGRLRKLPKEQGFADIDIDLGGEVIHGNKSEYFKLVKENGGEIFEYLEENKFYINYKDQFESIYEMVEKPEHTDLKFIWDTYNDISYEPDVTLRKFLEMNNISKDVYPLAKTMFAIISGTDIDHISVHGFNKVCRDWRSGISNYFLKNCSQVHIISKAFSSAIEKVFFNTQVVNVNYPENKNNDFSQSKIKVSTSDDKIFECDILIITVPIMILKNLTFEPKLPTEHQRAIETLKMDNVAKLLLKFKKCLLPDHCSFLIITGTNKLLLVAYFRKKFK